MKRLMRVLGSATMAGLVLCSCSGSLVDPDALSAVLVIPGSTRIEGSPPARRM